MKKLIIIAALAVSFLTFAQDDAEKTSFEEVCSKLDSGGDFYLYLSAEKGIKAFEKQIGMIRELIVAGDDYESDNELRDMVRLIDLGLRFFRQSGLNEISGFGMSSRKESGLYTNKIVVHHYPDEASGSLWSVFGEKAHKLEGLGFLPEDTALAGFTEIKAGMLWEWISTEIEVSGIEKAVEGLREMKSELAADGIDIDSLLASIDGETGLVITLDRQEKTMVPSKGQALLIPQPGLLFVAKVNDSSVFDLIQRKTFNIDHPEKSIARRADSDGRKVLLFVMGIPMIPGPATVVQTEDGYLMAASSMKIIDKALAVREGKAGGLVSTDEFRELSRGIPLDGNGFKYVSSRIATEFLEIQKKTFEKESGNLNMRQKEIIEQLFRDSGDGFRLFSVSSVQEDGFVYHGNCSHSIANMFLMQGFVGSPAIMAGMLLPALSDARTKAREISCASNLKQIGLALRMYSMDHGEKFPVADGVAGFEVLRKQGYLENAQIYICPQSGDKAATPLTEKSVSYVYLGGFSESDSVDIPLAFDKPGNHKRSVNVLFLDGHVQGYRGKFETCVDIVRKVCKDLPEKELRRLMDKADMMDNLLSGGADPALLPAPPDK